MSTILKVVIYDMKPESAVGAGMQCSLPDMCSMTKCTVMQHAFLPEMHIVCRLPRIAMVYKLVCCSIRRIEFL